MSAKQPCKACKTVECHHRRGGRARAQRAARTTGGSFSKEARAAAAAAAAAASSSSGSARASHAHPSDDVKETMDLLARSQGRARAGVVATVEQQERGGREHMAVAVALPPAQQRASPHVSSSSSHGEGSRLRVLVRRPASSSRAVRRWRRAWVNARLNRPHVEWGAVAVAAALLFIFLFTVYK